MALSDYEKQVLEQMEAELQKADPGLASTMSEGPDLASVPPAGRGRVSPRRIAIGSVLAVVGLGVVLGGVAVGQPVWSILLGVLGFAMMVGGIFLALSTTGSSSRNRRSRRTGASRPSGPRGGWSRFIQDQERRWDTRDDS